MEGCFMHTKISSFLPAIILRTFLYFVLMMQYYLWNVPQNYHLTFISFRVLDTIMEIQKQYFISVVLSLLNNWKIFI